MNPAGGITVISASKDISIGRSAMRGECTQDLRQTVTIQVVSYTENTKGEPVPTWSTFIETRAYLEATSGSEWWGKQQVMTTANFEMVIRFLDGIVQTMRVLWNGRTFNITAVRDIDGHRRWLHILLYEAL
jgi:SPP1 family predicted phage head-tail adaptor